MKITTYILVPTGLILMLSIIINVNKTTLTNLDNNVIEPPAMQSYNHINYTAHNLKDPFAPSNYKNSMVVNYAKSISQSKQNQLKPDLTRHKEYLETFALDDLALIGVIKQGGETWALIADHSNTIHKVKSGNYLGKNFGKIQEITADHVLLQELVQNEQGDWINKQTNIMLNKNKNYKE